LNRGVGVLVPGAERVVGHWRREHDWVASCGLGAHVTVRSPFANRLEPATVESVVRAHLPLTLTLARVEDRPGALVVLVEPDDALRRLTAAFDAVVPDLPPHRGGRADLAYHVTVVRTADAGVRAAAAEELERALPLHVEARALTLFEWEQNHLVEVWRLPRAAID
jgi:2'-5' RNA ligase superfamily protein